MLSLLPFNDCIGAILSDHNQLEDQFHPLAGVGGMCGSDKVNTTLNSDQVLAAFLSLRIDHRETKVPHVQYASYPLMICTISTD